jgi:cytochrome c oxidase subunit III
LSEAREALAHHFDDLEQQHDAATLGMWVFLVTEIMFFGGLFLGYTVYRWKYPDVFAEASRHLDTTLGAVNTAVLLASSLTMALAVHAAQTSRRRALVAFLLATILLGSVFLGVKAYEYLDKYHHHLVPGVDFVYEAGARPQLQIFFLFYFFMTGMHALHMVIGIGLLGVIAALAARGRYGAHYYNPVEVTGLYWHFVDIVWIFLFPLLYLIGAHL